MRLVLALTGLMLLAGPALAQQSAPPPAPPSDVFVPTSAAMTRLLSAAGVASRIIDASSFKAADNLAPVWYWRYAGNVDAVIYFLTDRTDPDSYLLNRMRELALRCGKTGIFERKPIGTSAYGNTDLWHTGASCFRLTDRLWLDWIVISSSDGKRYLIEHIGKDKEDYRAELGGRAVYAAFDAFYDKRLHAPTNTRSAYGRYDR